MKRSEEQRISTDKRRKEHAIEIASFAAKVIENDKEKIGILLCEGTMDSMDVALYTEVYPQFVVVPVDGCTDIRKLMPFMRKYSEYTTFGIIDRDNLSKAKIRYMAKNESIYCTKLPFIENILCCPEVLKILCKESKRDYAAVLTEVRSRISNYLVEKMSLLNPFNIDLPKDREFEFVAITIVTKGSMIYKKVDLTNVMYTFRDKMIVSEVADVMGFRSRDDYYRFLKKQLKGNNRKRLLIAMAKYLPVIQLSEI